MTSLLVRLSVAIFVALEISKSLAWISLGRFYNKVRHDPRIKYRTARRQFHRACFSKQLERPGLVLGLPDDGENSTTVLNPNRYSIWEAYVESSTSEIRNLSTTQSLLAKYQDIIQVSSRYLLNPLQLVSFELLSSCLLDGLLRLRAPEAPVSSLIDELTQVHFKTLEFLSENRDNARNRGEKETLCYQFAILVDKVFDKLCQKLPVSFDLSSEAQSARREAWVAPVHARLREAFPDFVGAEVEEKAEEIYVAAVDSFLPRISMEFDPVLTISGKPSVSAELVKSSSHQRNSYGPIELSNFWIRICRNILYFCPVHQILDNALSGRFQNSIASSLIDHGRTLEDIYNRQLEIVDQIGGQRLLTTSSQRTAQDEKTPSVFSKEVTAPVHSALVTGHRLIGMLLTLWQYRHNILEKSSASTVDYLHALPWPLNTSCLSKPVPFDSMAGESAALLLGFQNHTSRGNWKSILTSLPRKHRHDIEMFVENLLEEQPSGENNATSSDKTLNSSLSDIDCRFLALGMALRESATENFHAALTYNTNEDEWPKDRDESFMGILSVMLIESWLAKDFDIDEITVNLMSVIALEEAFGVREPRRAIAFAYKLALRWTLQQTLLDSSGTATVITTDELKKRVVLTERRMQHLLRMSVDLAAEARQASFQETVEGMLRFHGLAKVLDVSRALTDVLRIDNDLSQAIIEPLGMKHFDQALGEILMNSDIASGTTASNSDIDNLLLSKVFAMAEKMLMSKEAAESRIRVLSAAIMRSCMEAILEADPEDGRRIEGLTKKAYQVYSHPILRALTGSSRNAIDKVDKGAAASHISGPSFLANGIRATIDAVGKDGVLALLRALGQLQSTLERKTDDLSSISLKEFVMKLHGEFLTEYTSIATGI